MSTQPSSAGTYIYCIGRAEALVNGSPPFRARAIGGRDNPVYTVRFMNLAAVVSDSPAARVDISRANTMAHQIVVEEAMTRCEVLPVRFGTVSKSDDAIVEKLLKRRFGELNGLMRYVEGRVELGLKVFWNRERLFAEIASEIDLIRTLRDTIVGRPPEETHYQRIQLGQLTEEAIVRKRDQEAEAITAALRPIAVETKVNKILTDTMVLNASFLVDEACEQEFDARVSTLDKAQAERLILKYVGPLPPYNFINLVVHWEEE